MAPPPEYDKEPKAPDKSATTVTNDEIKVHTLVNDLPTFSDHKTSNSASNNETENNKHVESLDDGQLRALLDEAIQYKCPKDREGKSSLFKELLEEVEHQDEVSEAASRGFIARGGPHANSLQDLMAALKVESATRPVRHQPPPHSQTSVSARAIHGGSLPSGVDTSFLLAEEPTRGGYLATVRCVNPPPLAERRVSASDANTPAEMELLNKRSKPMFPMYTTRASLEIGSGSVCSGRAVTTTTPSNQVRTPSPPRPAHHRKRFHHRALNNRQVQPSRIHWTTTQGPPERIYKLKSLYQPEKPSRQEILMSALRPKRAENGKDQTGIALHNFSNNTIGNYSQSERMEDRRTLGPIRADDAKGEKKNKDEFIGHTRSRGPGCKNTEDAPLLCHNEHKKFNSEKFAATVNNWYKHFSSKCGAECNDYKSSSVGMDTTNVAITGDKSTGKISRSCHSEQIHQVSTPVTQSETDSQVKALHLKYTSVSEAIPSGPGDTHAVGVSLFRHNEKNMDKHAVTKCAVSGKKDDMDTKNNMSMSNMRRYAPVETNNCNILQPLQPEQIQQNKKNSQDFLNTIQDSQFSKSISVGSPKNCFPLVTKTGAPLCNEYTKDTKNLEKNGNTIDNWYKSLTHYSVPIDVYNNNDCSMYRFSTIDKINQVIDPNIEINIAKGNDPPSFANNNNYIESVHNTENVGNRFVSDGNDNDVWMRDYRKRVGKLQRASLSSINPRNIKSMTIGKPEEINQSIVNPTTTNETLQLSDKESKKKTRNIAKLEQASLSSVNNNFKKYLSVTEEAPKRISDPSLKSNGKESKSKVKQKAHGDNNQMKSEFMDAITTSRLQPETESNASQNVIKKREKNILIDSHCKTKIQETKDSVNYKNDENLFEMKDMSELRDIDSDDIEMECISKTSIKRQSMDSFSTFLSNQQNLFSSLESDIYTTSENIGAVVTYNHNDNGELENIQQTKENIQIAEVLSRDSNSEKVKEIDYVLTDPSNPEIEIRTETSEALTQISNVEDLKPRNENLLEELTNNACVFLTFPKHLPTLLGLQGSRVLEENKTYETNDKSVAVGNDKEQFNKSSLRVLLQSLLKRQGVDRGIAGSASVAKEVDSTIPFSCITTPEVVASCNTTSSTVQAAVAVDPKPRSVISSTFNGLPLSRPNYGATGSAAADEYKKSLDENGNAVQGIGSPVSGSSQHKKPRRKKSSKNETVIKSHQIDGYQGNKDLNEVLRFIESNADAGRGGKLRGKHKDDDDKGKKRSAERRKAQEKGKRASSLEELSRTKLEDLTDAPEPPPAKPERRSWGDDARDAFYFRAAEPEPAPDHDFQTVTKRRKPRRERPERDERAERARARPPEPRPRRESAPPSDRSNDSNDDMDSVHSLPAPPRAPLAAPHASYADIARTRHNIPDLIESCNFYAEGEAGEEARGAEAAEAAPQPADADGYPALEARPRRAAKAAAPRRERKPAPPECPAPDVVADRRPPVILLDSGARPRDMDGVTFGFDVNEQLLGGARRGRCDLLRDAEPPAQPVRAAGAALRFLPPAPPTDTHHLLQIIDYVGTAWEDVIRCGAGKVRYFSE